MPGTKFYVGIDLRGQRAVNAGDAAAPTDLVTLQQLQAYARGLDWKDAVVAATTGNINLASPGASHDGVTLAVGDRFLVWKQSTGSQNGIYVFQGATSQATRSVDADASAEVTAGLAVTVLGGTMNRINGLPTAYVLTTADPIVLGTTALSFSPLGGGAAPYVAGDGLTSSGQTFNVGAGNGILVDADAVKVDPTVVARKFSAACVATTNPQTFAHGLGTDDIDVTVWESQEEVKPGITKGSGIVIIDWGSAPTAGQYRVTVLG